MSRGASALAFSNTLVAFPNMIALLSVEDLRILSSAINWMLNDDPPHIKQVDERQTFRILRNEISIQQHVARIHHQQIKLTLGDKYLCDDGCIQLSRPYLDRLWDALSKFVQENSSAEQIIVTGTSADEISNLIEKISSLVGTRS